MTYNEAVQKKKEIGDFYDERDDITYKVVIAPLNEEDFTSFVEDYRNRNRNDKSCLNYSSDGSFKVHYLWTDGINVLGKRVK